MAGHRWFIVVKGEEQGPISGARLKELAAAGKIRPDRLIRREDLDRAVPAAKIRGLLGPETVAKPSRKRRPAGKLPLVFFVVEQGSEHGPYEIEQLRILADQGRIHPDSRLRNIALDYTNSARRVKGLFREEMLTAHPDPKDDENQDADADDADMEPLMAVDAQESAPSADDSDATPETVQTLTDDVAVQAPVEPIFDAVDVAGIAADVVEESSRFAVQRPVTPAPGPAATPAAPAEPPPAVQEPESTAVPPVAQEPGPSASAAIPAPGIAAAEQGYYVSMAAGEAGPYPLEQINEFLFDEDIGPDDQVRCAVTGRICSVREVLAQAVRDEAGRPAGSTVLQEGGSHCLPAADDESVAEEVGTEEDAAPTWTDLADPIEEPLAEADEEPVAEAPYDDLVTPSEEMLAEVTPEERAMTGSDEADPVVSSDALKDPAIAVEEDAERVLGAEEERSASAAEPWAGPEGRAEVPAAEAESIAAAPDAEPAWAEEGLDAVMDAPDEPTETSGERPPARRGWLARLLGGGRGGTRPDRAAQAVRPSRRRRAGGGSAAAVEPKPEGEVAGGTAAHGSPVGSADATAPGGETVEGIGTASALARGETLEQDAPSPVASGESEPKVSETATAAGSDEVVTHVRQEGTTPSDPACDVPAEPREADANPVSDGTSGPVEVSASAPAGEEVDLVCEQEPTAAVAGGRGELPDGKRKSPWDRSLGPDVAERWQAWDDDRQDGHEGFDVLHAERNRVRGSGGDGGGGVFAILRRSLVPVRREVQRRSLRRRIDREGSDDQT